MADTKPDHESAEIDGPSLPEAASPGGGGTVAPIDPGGLHQVSGRSGLGLALVLTTVALWAMLPIALKIVLGGMDAMTLTWYRFVAASLLLGPILAVRGTLPDLRGLPRSAWLLLTIAVGCLSTNYAFYVLGLERTNASTAQVIIQIAPVLLAIGGICLFKERFGWLQWMGLAVMVTGLLVFSRDQIANLLADISSFYSGVLFIIAAAVAWAAYGLAQKQLLKDVGANDLLLLVYIAGAICFLPASSPSQIQQLDGLELAVLAFASLNTIIAYGSFGMAMTHWEVSRVSATITITPLLTLFLVFLSNAFYPGFIQMEPLDWMNWLGALLVVGGSTLAALGNRL